MSTTLQERETATSWSIDATHTTAEFAVKHMMLTTVRGRITGVSGTITVDAANPNASTATVDLDLTTIDTGAEQRDAHLKSADFFDVAQFPTITFRSRRIEGATTKEGASFRVIGDLTIHGTTREVTLDVTYEGRGRDPWGGERVSFSADTKIDRREFGLTWNAALETGGVLVSNDVKIHLDVQAVRA
jgi:polyisoprenoid-binding protein YceI